MRSDQFNRISKKFVAGTELEIRLLNGERVVGKLSKLLRAAETQDGAVTIVRGKRPQRYVASEIRAIKLITAEKPRDIQREFCSICKVSFEVGETEFFAYSEAEGDSAVYACGGCLHQYGKQQIIPELAKYYLTRQKMRGVLRSILGHP